MAVCIICLSTLCAWQDTGLGILRDAILAIMKRGFAWVRWTVIIIASLLCGLALLLFADGGSSADAQVSDPVRVIESNTSHVVLELDISSYDARVYRVGSATYTLLSVPGFGESNEAGKPQLPIKGAMVGIPPGALATLRIISVQSKLSTLSNPPPPAPTVQVQRDPRQALPRSTTNAYVPNAAAYLSDQLYPAGSARIASTGNWRSQHFVTVEFHPLQYNAASRQLVFHSQVRVDIAFTYPRGPTTQALSGAVNEGPFESVLQNSLVNYASAKNWRTPRTTAPRAPSNVSPSPVNGGTWFRLGVSADGMYRVTCGELAAQHGGSLSVADPTTLQLFKQVFTTTVEYAINVVDYGGWSNCGTGDTSDYVDFFGQANKPKAPNTDTVYTDTNIYWLTYGNSTGKRMATRDGSGSGTPATQFTNTIHLEQHLLYRPTAPMVDGADHWYWTQFYNPTVSASYPFTLSNVGTSGSASLQIDLYGFSTGSNHTIVSVNGNPVTDTVWTGPAEFFVTFPVTQSIMVSGTNTILVNEPTSSQIVFLNYFNLSYQSTFTTTTDTLEFQQPTSGNWQYSIGGFSTPSIETFDITDPFNVAVITPTVVSSGPPYTLQFADSITSPHIYIALTSTQLQSMAPAVTLYTAPNPSNLRIGPSGGADYIAISNGAFLPSLQPLIDLRASQYPGRVVTLDVQNVYDQFNDGVVDPQAIRDFLACTQGTSVPSPDPTCPGWNGTYPSYVLLVGDGTFDPKGYCANPGTCPDGTVTPLNSTNLPPFLRMVDPFIGETASDNRFVSFNDNAATNPNTLPWISIGRLPADTTNDVTAMVSKILSYEQNPPNGPWRSRVAFVAGNAYDQYGNLDSAGNFWSQSDEVASNSLFMPSPLVADRIYFNPCNPSTYPYCTIPYPPYTTVASVESAINSAINNGHLIVNYVGHSYITDWGAYTPTPVSLFTEGDVTSLTNGNLTPVMLEMTCLTGYFIAPGSPSLAEMNLRRSNGGAVASWAATGEGVGELGHDLLDEGFFNAVMNQNTRQLGPATIAGKNYLFANSGGTNLDLIDTFLLFGDPATRLPIQFVNYLPLIMK
jgi:Peptidase family C25/Propeptide_C25